MVCFYSGEKITPATMQVDHRTPIERGGSNDFSNLCLASKASNNAKGALTEEEYRSLMACIETFHDGGKDVLRRLRASSYIYGR